MEQKCIENNGDLSLICNQQRANEAILNQLIMTHEEENNI